MGRITRSACLPLLSVLLVLGSAACGSSSKSSSLLTPSALETTATISGSVEGGATSSSVSSQSHHSSAGLRVSILGTGVSTTTDGSGRFTLSGVPAGQVVTLRFEGPGIDARVEIGGLTPGQVLHVTIQVSGSSAHVVGVGSDDPSPSPTPSPTANPSPTPSPSPSPDDHGENEAEFKGTIESISAPNLTVAGRLVVTDASTRIKSHGDTIPFSTLAVGNVVEVEGQTLADGSVLAQQISLEDSGDDGDDNGDDNGGDDNGGDDNSGEDFSGGN